MYKIIEGITVDQIRKEMDEAAGDGYEYLGSLTGQHGSVIIMGEVPKVQELLPEVERYILEHETPVPEQHTVDCPECIKHERDQFPEDCPECARWHAQRDEARFGYDNMTVVAGMIKDAVETDGAHHKQWYLERIAERLEVELPDHDEGIPA